MTEPTHLSYEKFLPLAIALRPRDRSIRDGLPLLLPPFPICPACGQAPTELFVNGDHPARFVEDQVAFGFRPCGHNFTVDGDDLVRAYDIARREAP